MAAAKVSQNADAAHPLLKPIKVFADIPHTVSAVIYDLDGRVVLTVQVGQSGTLSTARAEIELAYQHMLTGANASFGEHEQHLCPSSVAEITCGQSVECTHPVLGDTGDELLFLRIVLPRPRSTSEPVSPAAALSNDIKHMLFCIFGLDGLQRLYDAPAEASCRDAGLRFAACLPWLAAHHCSPQAQAPQVLRSLMHHGLASLRAMCTAVAGSLAATPPSSPPAVAFISQGAVLEGNAQWWQWAASASTHGAVAPLLVQQACAAHVTRHCGQTSAAGAGADPAEQLCFATQQLWLPARSTAHEHTLYQVFMAPVSVAIRDRAPEAHAGTSKSVRRSHAGAAAPAAATAMRPVLSTAGDTTSVRLLVLQPVPAAAAPHNSAPPGALQPPLRIHLPHESSPEAGEGGGGGGDRGAGMEEHMAVRIAVAVANAPADASEACVACLAELDKAPAVVPPPSQALQRLTPWPSDTTESMQAGSVDSAAILLRRMSVVSKPVEGGQEEPFAAQLMRVAVRAVARRNMLMDMHLSDTAAGTGESVLPAWSLLPAAPWPFPTDAFLGNEGKAPLLAVIASSAGDTTAPPLLAVWMSDAAASAEAAATVGRAARWQAPPLPPHATDALLVLKTGTAFVKIQCSEALSVTAVLKVPPLTPSHVPLAIGRSLVQALAAPAWDVFAVHRTVPSQQRLAEGQQQLTPALSTLVTPPWYVSRGGREADTSVLALIAAAGGHW